MGKTILTTTQYQFLELATKEKTIAHWFYLTGGTALSEFYLHHRLSEDLDFFTEDMELNENEIDSFIQKTARIFHTSYQKNTHMGIVVYRLYPKNKEVLKVDFVHQPFKQLEFGKKYERLRIASLWDIMVDKLYTIFNRATARDFVDLYFGIQEVGCDLNQLINAMEEKYNAGFDRLSLLSRFPVVKDVTDYPKMLIPFDKKEMEDFFLNEVKKLQGEIFK